MPVWIVAAIPQILAVAKMILGALLAFILGRWIIGKLVRLTDISLKRKRFDPTLGGYILSLSSIALNIFLIIAILGIFGVDTTSFAAWIAAAGLAIGAAWSGMMSNFAAGFFIILFHPFKVGDFVKAAGVSGFITEIGMFAVTIDTLDNVYTVVPNAKAAGGVIENYSRNAVDLRAQLAHGVDPNEAISRLRPVIAAIPNLLQQPAPCIEILEFDALGPKLYCLSLHEQCQLLAGLLRYQ